MHIEIMKNAAQLSDSDKKAGISVLNPVNVISIIGKVSL